MLKREKKQVFLVGAKMDVKIYDNERVDALFANQVKIIQSDEVFAFSLDAVLLANFTNPAKKKQQKIVDLCAGNGAVGLFLTAKTSAKIYEVEIQKRLANMAQRSVILNDLDQQVEVINADLNNILTYLPKDSIDTITCNPPYFTNQPDSKKNPNHYLALARHELTVTLAQTIEQSANLLKMNGKVCFVHRPERLLEMVALMQKNRLAPKRIQLVYPKAGREANMVLVEAIKDGKPGGVRFLEPLVVYGPDGNYTPAIRKMIYG